VTRMLRVHRVPRFLLMRGRDDHDGDTSGVGVALVGCLVCVITLVCVTVGLCCTVVTRLAALLGEAEGDAARDTTRADAQVCVRDRSLVLHSVSHSVACEQSLVRCWTTVLLLKQ